MQHATPHHPRSLKLFALILMLFQGNILNNFATDSIAANASRGLLAITMIFTYPMQALVARHIISKVFFNGDFEGHSAADNNNNSSNNNNYQEAANKVPVFKLCCGCFGRREQVIVAIYITTLLTALVLDDLGPVLSITGAIGGSCLAFIGPGLAYLGAHGDYFLEYTDGMMVRRKASPVDPATELSAVGDTKALVPLSATDACSGRTPWWWCIVLMPMWRSIASTGSRGMRIRLDQLEEETPGCTKASPIGEVIGPVNGDFYLAMFMIIFGAIAAVAGVASNLYVQLQKKA
jgi:Transmembrane amino acid transporter protein